MGESNIKQKDDFGRIVKGHALVLNHKFIALLRLVGIFSPVRTWSPETWCRRGTCGRGWGIRPWEGDRDARYVWNSGRTHQHDPERKQAEACLIKHNDIKLQILNEQISKNITECCLVFLQGSTSGKKYKFVVTGHGKYEKIPVDDENGEQFDHGKY